MASRRAGWWLGAAALTTVAAGTLVSGPLSASAGASGGTSRAVIRASERMEPTRLASLEARQEHARRLIEQQTFAALPKADRNRLAALGYAPDGVRPSEACCGVELPESIEEVVSPKVLAALSPIHRRVLETSLAEARAGKMVPMLCLSPDTSPETAEAFAQVMDLIGRFQQTGRWEETATNGSNTGGQGDRVTLTFSFVPDGTLVPGSAGFGPGTSDLFTYMNGIYGTPAVWQAIYAGMFARWGQLCGNIYVFEPNDDGAELDFNPGVLGVRGDLRMSGKFLDGNSGVLAYNNFPDNGDMVVDTGDNFYFDVSGESLRLRNVLAHEHGHGMGQLHVCPRNQTKLMEPFISVAYDGPQFDDILNAQRHYGDPLEPNDTAATATPLLAANTTLRTVSTVSCDDSDDTDWFRLTVAASAGLEVTVRPVGTTYDQGPQTSGCLSGSPFNPTTVNDLTLDLVAANGTTVLTSSNAGGAGTSETFRWPVTPGDYFIRIRPGGVNNIQAYALDYRVNNTPGIFYALPGPLPTVAAPGDPVTVQVQIVTINDGLTGATVHFRPMGTGAFQSMPLTAMGNNLYQAQLPGLPCGSTPQYYFRAVGALTPAVTLPANAPTSTFAFDVGTDAVEFDDDAQTDQGWQLGVAGDTASSGVWERGNPNGTSAQPEDDFSTDGTNCFFTGQAAVGQQAGTNDVDGGFTTLLSPIIDVSGATRVSVSYARWFDNSSGAGPNNDTFLVELSSNGGTSWAPLEAVGPSGAGTSGGWIEVTHDLTSLLATAGGGTNLRLRFTCNDQDPQSLLEAAIDEVRVTLRTCSEPTCTADWNESGTVDSSDFFAFLDSFFAGNADFNNSGATDSSDFFAFLAAFLEGC